MALSTLREITSPSFLHEPRTCPPKNIFPPVSLRIQGLFKQKKFLVREGAVPELEGADFADAFVAVQSCSVLADVPIQIRLADESIVCDGEPVAVAVGGLLEQCDKAVAPDADGDDGFLTRCKIELLEVKAARIMDLFILPLSFNI